MSKNLISARAAYKGRISLIQKMIKDASDLEKVKLISDILSYQIKIKDYDEKIIDSLDNETEIATVIDDFENYHQGVDQLLEQIKTNLSPELINSATSTSN